MKEIRILKNIKVNGYGIMNKIIFTRSENIISVFYAMAVIDRAGSVDRIQRTEK